MFGKTKSIVFTFEVLYISIAEAGTKLLIGFVDAFGAAFFALVGNVNTLDSVAADLYK